MKTEIQINLATNPFRNRRLSLLLNGLLAAVLICMAALSVSVYIRYSSRLGESRQLSQDAQARFAAIQKEQRALNRQIAEISGAYQTKIDFLNQVIRKKSFSWSDFLFDLEEMLPDYSYIVSLTPHLKGASEVEVRLRMASPGVTHLAQFINNLHEKKYKGVRVNHESETERGFLLSEVIFVYTGND